MTRRTLAWPSAWLFGVLVAYASLYPFKGWWVQGISPIAFLWAPFPQYWTAFDLVSNLVGYVLTVEAVPTAVAEWTAETLKSPWMVILMLNVIGLMPLGLFGGLILALLASVRHPAVRWPL